MARKADSKAKASADQGLHDAAAARSWEMAAEFASRSREGLEALARGKPEAEQALAEIGPEVERWKSESWKDAARQIGGARFIARVPTDDIETGLSPEMRAVLGEVCARDLLRRAEYWVGRGEGNLAEATKLTAADGATPALDGLRQPVERVEKLAKALAAERELGRRRFMEQVAERAEKGGPAAEVKVLDARGKPKPSPLDRYGRYLDPRARDAVKDYAGVLERQLAEKDPAIGALTTASVGARWDELDRPTAMQVARHRRERDALCVEGQVAARDIGRKKAFAKAAENVSRTKENPAEAKKYRLLADEALQSAAVSTDTISVLAQQMKEVDGEAAELNERASTPEKFLAEHPDAALAEAAHNALLARAQEQEQAAKSEDKAKLAEVAAEVREPADAGVGMEA